MQYPVLDVHVKGRVGCANHTGVYFATSCIYELLYWAHHLYNIVFNIKDEVDLSPKQKNKRPPWPM